MAKDLKIALVHDDLVQWGGAERVLHGLSELFQNSPIYTSVFDKNNKILWEKFGNKKIITSFLQKIPGWKNIYKALLPLYPIAFEQFDFSQFDIVISQTTRFAKSIITKPYTKHVCYCHTPPRFLWNYSGVRHNPIFNIPLSYFRLYDRISSKRVDYWIAGSENAKERIKKVYGTDSKVIFPFVDLKRFDGVESFDGGYLLVVSRLVGYKRVDLVILAAIKLEIPIKIVGTGPSRDYLESLVSEDNKNRIEFLGTVDENTLSFLIAGCKALVVAAEEDFGLCSLEAQAMGKPVIAYKAGGASETVIDGETGFLFNSQTVEDLVEAISRLDKTSINSTKCVENANVFSKEIFFEQFKRHINFLHESEN